MHTVIILHVDAWYLEIFWNNWFQLLMIFVLSGHLVMSLLYSDTMGLIMMKSLRLVQCFEIEKNCE